MRSKKRHCSVIISKLLPTRFTILKNVYGLTEIPTNGWTDIPFYTDAWVHLKILFKVFAPLHVQVAVM